MILLTGSSGFIGTNIIKYFVKKKIKFHAVDLKKNNYLYIKNFTRLDLSNKNKVEKLFKKIKPKLIIHLAAISGVNSCNDNINSAFKNNIQATFNILSNSNKFNCKKVLLASLKLLRILNLRQVYMLLQKKHAKIWQRHLKLILNLI